MHIQDIVNLLCAVLAFSMFTIIVKKLRCRKNTEEGELKYELRLSTELMIHCFYILLTLKHIAQVCLRFAIPVSRYFNWIISKRTEKKLCGALMINTLTTGVLYQVALNNILVNRANNAFKGTNDAFKTVTNYGLRIGAATVWMTIYFILIFYFMPRIFEEDVVVAFASDGTCINYQSEAMRQFVVLPAVQMAVSILMTLGVFGIFMKKVVRFRNAIAFHSPESLHNDDDFLLKIIKKQTVIMFFVAITSIALPISLPVVQPYLGITPMIMDYAANGIAIFLSFSFNASWYKWCKCHLCANALFECIGYCHCPRQRAPQEAERQISRHLQISVELAVQPAVMSNIPNNEQPVNRSNEPTQDIPMEPLSKEIVVAPSAGTNQSALDLDDSKLSQSKRTDNVSIERIQRGYHQKSVSQGMNRMMRNEAISESKLPGMSPGKMDGNGSVIEHRALSKRTISTILRELSAGNEEKMYEAEPEEIGLDIEESVHSDHSDDIESEDDGAGLEENDAPNAIGGPAVNAHIAEFTPQQIQIILAQPSQVVCQRRESMDEIPSLCLNDTASSTSMNSGYSTRL